MPFPIFTTHLVHSLPFIIHNSSSSGENKKKRLSSEFFQVISLHKLWSSYTHRLMSDGVRFFCISLHLFVITYIFYPSIICKQKKIQRTSFFHQRNEDREKKRTQTHIHIETKVREVGKGSLSYTTRWMATAGVRFHAKKKKSYRMNFMHRLCGGTEWRWVW